MSNRIKRKFFKAIYNGKLGKVKRLMELGADVNGYNREGDTPLVLACLSGEISSAVCVLADVFPDKKLGMYGDRWALDMVTLLIESGADVNKASRINNITPLIAAVITNNIEIVKVLLASGADINQPGGMFNRTPLIMAARMGFTDIVHELLMAGADTSVRDKDGNTAYFSAKSSLIKAVILEFGGGPCYDGRTA